MNFFDHKDLPNHLLQLWPKVVKHPVYIFFSSVLCKFYVLYSFTAMNNSKMIGRIYEVPSTLELLAAVL
jgi:hypothetical protein